VLFTQVAAFVYELEMAIKELRGNPVVL